MPKREKKQKRDGNLATALKEANVTPEAFRVPDLGIKPKVLATKVLAKVAEAFAGRALPYHADDITADVLVRRGFQHFQGKFKVVPEPDDALLAQIASNIAAAILWDHPEGHIATTAPEIDGYTVVTVANVTAAFAVEWDASVAAYALTFHAFVLAQPA